MVDGEKAEEGESGRQEVKGEGERGGGTCAAGVSPVRLATSHSLMRCSRMSVADFFLNPTKRKGWGGLDREPYTRPSRVEGTQKKGQEAKCIFVQKKASAFALIQSDRALPLPGGRGGNRP